MASLNKTVEKTPPKGIWGALQALGYGLVDRPTTASYPGAEPQNLGIERNIGQTVGELIRQGGMKLNNPQIQQEQSLAMQEPFKQQTRMKGVKQEATRKGLDLSEVKSPEDYDKILGAYYQNYRKELAMARNWLQANPGQVNTDQAFNYLITKYPEMRNELKTNFYPKSSFWDMPESTPAQ